MDIRPGAVVAGAFSGIGLEVAKQICRTWPRPADQRRGHADRNRRPAAARDRCGSADRAGRPPRVRGGRRAVRCHRRDRPSRQRRGAALNARQPRNAQQNQVSIHHSRHEHRTADQILCNPTKMTESRLSTPTASRTGVHPVAVVRTTRYRGYPAVRKPREPRISKAALADGQPRIPTGPSERRSARCIP